MGKSCAVKVVKRSAVPKFASPGAQAEPGQFLLIDNEDDTFVVNGVDTGGQPVDISGVATLTQCESSEPSVLTVDPPAGMASAMHAQRIGLADINVTATWNDGSLGPFSFTLPVSVETGGVKGIQIVPGVPVAR